jgi:hypothetical protein
MLLKFSIRILSIMTFSTISLNITKRKFDIQHNEILHFALSNFLFVLNAERRNKIRYAERRYAECRYAE